VRLLLAVALAVTGASPRPVVVEAAPVEEVVLLPGGRAEAVLKLTIRPAFKVQANPAADSFLVPLTLTVTGAPPVRAGPGAVPAVLALEGRLRCQACDDRVCLRPAEIPVRVPVRIRQGR